MQPGWNIMPKQSYQSFLYENMVFIWVWNLYCCPLFRTIVGLLKRPDPAITAVIVYEKFFFSLILYHQDQLFPEFHKDSFKNVYFTHP